MVKQTYSAKPTEVTRNWYVIDASAAPLGRIASHAARYLTGKHKAQYTPHIDCGDHVIITNAAKLKVTGKKMENKTYYRHSGYPGGLKTRTLTEQMKHDPRTVIEHAVGGMLPKNRLADQRLQRLRVYKDENHNHEAQKPKTIEV